MCTVVFWVCCSSAGYPFHGEIYLGKPPDGVRQTNIGENVVLSLMRPYLNAGRNVTMDNFFTTLPLARKLLSNRTTLVGTLRKNKRYIPLKLRPERQDTIGKNKFAFREEGGTLVSSVTKKNIQHRSPDVPNVHNYHYIDSKR